MKTRSASLAVCIVFVTAAVLAGCGEKETPEQKVQRLRYGHEIFPVAAKNMKDREGNPSLLVDLQVANQGGEALSKLTVLVKIVSAEGEAREIRRVTLDMAGVRPGVGARVSASLPGVELLDDDEVTVELETGLTAEELRALPEFEEVAPVS